MHDEWNDDSDEDWHEEDWGDDDDAPVDLVTCPSCGREVYEDAEQCPHCGDYIVADTSAWSGRPMWWIIGGLLGIIAVGFSLLLLGF